MISPSHQLMARAWHRERVTADWRRPPQTRRLRQPRIESMLRQRFSYSLDVFRHTSSCGVNHDMWAVPRLVFPANDFLPSWQSQSGDIGASCFHAVSMLLRIRTCDLDFDSPYLRPMRDADPSIAHELKWIDGVGNHGSTETKIVLGDRIADAIASVFEGLANHAGVANSLLNRVDA